MRAFNTLVLTLFISCISAACATKLPPVQASFDGKTSFTSSMSARVTRKTGEVAGSISQPMRIMPIAGTYIGVPGGPAFDARFGIDDQEDTKNLLADELKKLGLIKTLISIDSNEDSDLVVELDFIKTELVHQNLFYVLDIELNARSRGKVMNKTYHIDVHEEDSSVERWHSTFSRNKIKAKKRLLERAIPDIERFLREVS